MATHNGSQGWAEDEVDMFKWHGTELIFIPLMMCTGIFGNGLVLYVTLFLWPSAIFSFFIKVLAILDMSNLLLALPMFLATVVHSGTRATDHLCKGTTFIALFTAITSALVLVVIAINRYRKLCRPTRYQVTLSLAKKVTLGCSVFGMAISLPSVFMFGTQTMPYSGDVGPVNISYCFIRHEVKLPLFVWATIIGLTFSAVTTTLVVLYGATIRELRQHDQRRQRMSRRPSTVSDTTKKVSIKHTRVFIGITVAFFTTYSPYLVTVVLLIADRSIESTMGPVAKAFFDLAKMCPLLSNVCNPVIYSFTSERFRAECVKLLTLRPCRRLMIRRRQGSLTSSGAQVSRSETEET